MQRTVKLAMSAAALLLGICGGFVACGGTDSSGASDGDAGIDGGGGIDGDSIDGTTGGDGAIGNGDGGGNDGGACAPKTCAASYECGDLDDGCGHVLTCGKPCTGGKVCDANTHTCQAPSASCTAQNAQCGYVKDACGVRYDCGACPAGKVCDGTTHQCVTPTASDAGACVPGNLSCTGPQGQALCGTIGNGCGGTKTCACPAGQQCGGGGTPGVCGIPPECKNAGTCGTFTNACGSGTVNCGACPTGQTCNSNHQCQACTPNPNPCAGKMCGSASDGCGGTVSCGTCPGGDVCHSGACCKPLTCADLADGGAGDGGAVGCNAVPDGCGGFLNCNKCTATQRCVSDSCTSCPDCDGGVCDNTAQCCFPKTCADFPNAGCGAVNLGCDVYKVCNPCAAGQTCLGDGTCCVPQGCNGRTGLVDDGCGHQIFCTQG